MTALVTQHLPLVAGAPDGIKKLRALILELAVRGRLVSQQACDEPAEKLVSRIHSEKTRLAANGVIRRPGPLSSIDADRVPYVLPAGWSWARWDSVALKIGDIDHKMPETAAEGVPFVSPRDFYPGNVIDFDRAKRVSVEDFERLSAKIKAERGDLIYPRYGTIGENVLVNVDRDFLVSYSCAVIKVAHGFINPKYQFYFSLSDSARRQAKAAENKTTQANVGIKSIQEYLFPVPPLAEQHRIVAKVDELMALCDRLEADQTDAEAAHAQIVQALLDSLTQATEAADFRTSWQRMSEHFHTLFTTEASIDALKQTVLQLAVMGKLVSQVVTTDVSLVALQGISGEVPFAVPSTWKWVRLGQLCELVTSGSRGWKDFYADSGSVFIRSQDIKADRLEFDNKAFVKLPPSAEGARTLVAKDDLLITITGANVGKAAHIMDEISDAYVSQHVALVRLQNKRFSSYIHRWLIGSHGGRRLLLQSSYGAKPGLNLQNLKDLPVPLPPASEQREIVAKVDELIALCDQLKAQLSEACEQHAQLATVLVEQAVA